MSNNDQMKVIMDLIKKEPTSLEHLDNSIQLDIIKITPKYLQFVKEQTPEICLAAVKNHEMALKFVKKQTVDICLAAVQHNGSCLRFVHNQTKEICSAAVQNNNKAMRFVCDSEMALIAFASSYSTPSID